MPHSSTHTAHHIYPLPAIPTALRVWRILPRGARCACTQTTVRPARRLLLASCARTSVLVHAGGGLAVTLAANGLGDDMLQALQLLRGGQQVLPFCIQIKYTSQK